MSKAKERANILFIMTDQQRFDALSCHGGWIRTPHLDRLASEGVDLHGHYAQAPVCVPSRCTLFTGRYPHAHGVLENDARLASREIHLFKVLRQQGYEISYAGKNHLLEREEFEANLDRFDDFAGEGFAPSRTQLEYDFCERESIGRLASVGSYASAEFHDFPDEVTHTGRVANRALGFLDVSPIDRPWCVVASFSDPHVPHLAPRRFEGMYPTDSIELPEWDPSELDSKHPRVRVKRGAQGADRASDDEKRFYLSVYGAMCSFVDEQIGRLVAAARKRPDSERTLIVFVSDHGDFGWRHGLCKKDLLLYDDLLHVPAIFHFPARLPAAKIEKTLSEHADVMPTLLDLAGIEIPLGCQGKSIVPVATGLAVEHRDQVHAEICYPWMRSGFETAEAFRSAWTQAREDGLPLGRSAPYNVPGDHARCVRSADWKYIWYGDGFEELYDLAQDPSESRNLATTAACGDVLQRMRDRLREWAQAADPRSPAIEAAQREAFGRWKSVGN